MIRLVATVIGGVAGVIGVAGLMARYLPISNEATLILAVGAPHLTTVLCIAMIGVTLPRYFGPEKPAVPVSR